jgi:predicted nucleotidyltransferase
MQTKPVQTKAQVLSLLQKNKQNLHDFGVSHCGIFGSFVRDTAINTESDVDILVIFKPNQKTFDNFMHLSFFLEDLFGRTVDLVTIESLSPYIGPHILDEVEYVSINS